MDINSCTKRPYGIFPSKSSAVLFIGTLVTVIPITLMFWLGNTVIGFINGDNTDSKEEIVSPSKWLIAVLVPITFAIHGYRRGSVNFSGAVFGILIGFTLALSSYPFLGCLIAFFISGSQATKFRGELKRRFEENFKPGGNRNWVQVLCNGGPATFLALVYILDCGAGELPIDFDSHYHASWLSTSILGSFAAACGDTWSSELGSVMSSGPPVLITNLKPVPKDQKWLMSSTVVISILVTFPLLSFSEAGIHTAILLSIMIVLNWTSYLRGTNGGVSGYGVLFSFVGGLTIGFAYYVTLIYTVDSTLLERGPAQWPVMFIGGLAGLIGSIIDSYIGATLQYSGLHEKTGIIVQRPGRDIKHISGRDILDNHSVNLITNILLALITPKMANTFWV